MNRRRLLQLSAGAAVSGALPGFAFALDYPARPVRIIVPYPPGIAPDIVARLVAQALSERLKQQFVVDNRSGGASNVGTSIVAHAVPDGYTLLVVTTTNTINTSLYDNLDFRAPRTISAFDDFCLAERAVAAVVPRWVPDRGRLADRALLLHDATRTPPERTQAGAAATRSS